MNDIAALLKGNPYPGRGIILGKTPDGRRMAAVYFIMGRSVNSRNRVFERTPDGIRTKAFDPARLTDPSLVIYHPARFAGGHMVVTNGDQTDTVQRFLQSGRTFRDALMTREFEPDAPNYTPRISGLITPGGGYSLSILKSAGGDPACCCRYFFEYDAPIPGAGHFIHTYAHDGDPLPPFEGEPRAVAIGDSLEAYASAVWDALDADNRVSLYACELALSTGVRRDMIINKNN